MQLPHLNALDLLLSSHNLRVKHYFHCKSSCNFLEDPGYLSLASRLGDLKEHLTGTMKLCPGTNSTKTRCYVLQP
ncbi:hypothetical protein CI610_02918 [invertebrate metagenome]|uniref:Uncharacterized protein n=1 Tax=invertebrate metagenome TaxID=1711999 RepID=A0A2H9T4L7_9ZZZZ